MNYEGKTTEQVERNTARIPSLTFMGLAIGAMVASAALVLTGRKQLGNFVGQWAPTILIMGLYNKVTKEIALPQREGANAGYGMASQRPTTSGASAGF